MTTTEMVDATKQTNAGVPGAERSLGVWYTPGACEFRVVAQAERLRLRLVHPGTLECRIVELAREAGASDIWSATAPGDLRHWSYAYELEREGHTLTGIVDPWALLVREGRGYIVQESSTVTPRPPMEVADAIIYELHVRDFTRDPLCGVRADWRGKFLGLTQAGTKLNGTAYATGLDHIVELGVTVVQLMPVHSFSLPYNPEYEWGYMPSDFNAPHAGYAASVDLESPIREFKRLVSALHERGLRVTLDVVYNHTAEKWPARLRSFMALAPHTYFRFKDDGTPWDGSLCGNEFRSESEHGRRFIVESCLHWVREFGVDGFRFDLMGLIDQRTMQEVTNTLKAVDPTILVYGEPWASGPTPIEVNGKGKQRGKGWAVFSDDFRDALRGEVFDSSTRGFLAEGSQIARTKAALCGGAVTFADSPLEVINYIECHDNHTLQDRLRIGVRCEGACSEEERLTMNAMGALMLLTSQGIPFLHSGQEFGRTKEGQDNTFNLGDQINNIRWSDKAERFRLYGFYREAVRLRKEHPSFRLREAEQVRRALRFLDDHMGRPLAPGLIAYVLEDVAGRDRWSHALLAFNGSRAAVRLELPNAKAFAVEAGGKSTGASWRLWGMDGHVSADREVVSGALDLPAHWGAVLYLER